MVRRSNRAVHNPFIYEGYKGPDYFCDRIEETENVTSHMRNGINITLVSPRKIGKTGLIKHVFHHLRQSDKDAVCIYTDIFHTQNQYELTQALGRAIIQERLISAPNAFSKVLAFFSMWRPTISFDPITGAPTVSVSMERNRSEHTLESIFEYLKNCGKEVFFAIDEFQAITDYPEKGTEALLRSHIQFIPNTHFIFSGSKQHLMYDIFGSPKRPFYQSTAMVSLQPLHEEIYYAFAARFFNKKGGELAEQVFHYLYQLFNGYTWYIQAVLNRLYEYEKKVTDEAQVKDAVESILANKNDQYETLLSFLSGNQRSLLTAVAKEGIVAQPQANVFLQQYELPSASSVRKALSSLLEKDLIYYTSKGYIVYDRFFDIWLKRFGY